MNMIKVDKLGKRVKIKAECNHAFGVSQPWRYWQFRQIILCWGKGVIPRTVGCLVCPWPLPTRCQEHFPSLWQSKLFPGIDKCPLSSKLPGLRTTTLDATLIYKKFRGQRNRTCNQQNLHHGELYRSNNLFLLYN